MSVLEIQCKYSSVCAQAAKHSKQPQQHSCYRHNSTGVQGGGNKVWFTLHDITVDGDSSMHASLVTKVPGSGLTIRKVECANHVVKCCRGALEKLVAENPIHGEGQARGSHAKASDY